MDDPRLYQSRQLWAANQETRCPLLAFDATAGCYCASPQLRDLPLETRRLPCGPVALHRWCLDAERHRACTLHQATSDAA